MRKIDFHLLFFLLFLVQIITNQVLHLICLGFARNTYVQSVRKKRSGRRCLQRRLLGISKRCVIIFRAPGNKIESLATTDNLITIASYSFSFSLCCERAFLLLPINFLSLRESFARVHSYEITFSLFSGVHDCLRINIISTKSFSAIPLNCVKSNHFPRTKMEMEFKLELAVVKEESRNRKISLLHYEIKHFQAHIDCVWAVCLYFLLWIFRWICLKKRIARYNGIDQIQKRFALYCVLEFP